MGKVKTNWLLPGHSGRACRHEDIYTKQDKKTGKVYSVKLCNPNEEWSSDQESHRATFGKVSAAISAWIKENRAQGTADYQKVFNAFERQTRYSTLRGMMMAKGYYNVSEAGVVTVDVNKYASPGNTSGSGNGSGGNSELG